MKIGHVPPSPQAAPFVERCGRITQGEINRLAGAWGSLERDIERHRDLAEGARLAITVPGAAEAADEADWAFRWTLGIPGDGALYAAGDPIYGRAIQAIRMRALAVAGIDTLPGRVVEAMSGPWVEAVGFPDPSMRS